MTTKKILFAVMCVLLVLVIVMTGMVFSRFRRLLQSAPAPTETEDASAPSEASDPTVPSTDPTRPTAPSESLQPTESGHEHNFVLKEKIAPTCTEYGYSVYVCSCGKVDIPLEEQLPPLGHDFSHGQVIAPTCTEGGCTRFTCSRCEATEDRNPIPALGHKWDQGTKVPATCGEDAHTIYHCTNEGCKETKIDDIQKGTATGKHSFGEWEKQEDGSYIRKCAHCDATESSNDLKITAKSSSIAKDQAGNVYTLYEIFVGTEKSPKCFRYLIHNYLEQPADFTYYPQKGLLVSVKLESGNHEAPVLPICMDGSLQINLDGSFAEVGTDPNPPAEPSVPSDPSDATDPSDGKKD